MLDWSFLLPVLQATNTYIIDCIRVLRLRTLLCKDRYRWRALAWSSLTVRVSAGSILATTLWRTLSRPLYEYYTIPLYGWLLCIWYTSAQLTILPCYA